MRKRKKCSNILYAGITISLVLFTTCGSRPPGTVQFVTETSPIVETVANEFHPMLNAALVLEGGALRSLYTAGVLDVFIENGIDFTCIIGVSAGAMTGANYIAKHIGRSAKINILHSNDANYFGFKQLLLKGSIFNFNYIFYTPVKDLYPYNEDALTNPQRRFLVGATNCKTGQPVYFEKNNYDALVQALQASSSIQLVSKITTVDGIACLDGAISDPIGVHKAFSEGYDKVVMVLTRDIEYKAQKTPGMIKLLYKIFYRKYPELIITLNNWPSQYNFLLEDIKKMEQENNVFVIRPSREVKIKNIEKDARKLIELYFQGRDDAREMLPRMIEYINQ